jgi:hypothetical protein
MAAYSDQLQRSPVHLLHRAVQCAEDLFHGEMHRDNLTPRQVGVLIVVAEQEGLSQTGLVERTGIDRSTMADMVNRMQRKVYCSAAVPRRTLALMPSRLRTKADARFARPSHLPSVSINASSTRYQARRGSGSSTL